MSTPMRPSGGVRLREVVTSCRFGNERSSWASLVGELRRHGYLSAADDPERLWSAQSPRFDVEIPDDVCSGLRETVARVRFRPSHGYLARTFSTSAPLSWAEAFRRYGTALMVRALADVRGRAEIPGCGGQRVRQRLWKKLWFLCIPILGPRMVLALIHRSVTEMRRRDTSAAHRTPAWLVSLLGAGPPAAAFAAVCWAWFAIPLPPDGVPARLAVALPAAGTAAFLVVIPWWVFLALASMRPQPTRGDDP
ncbi:hypothetical protein [Embleya sp. NPDC020886]|uniref:hypothetical protein n=1 Tax=Embleya sp. NPDC020886 TaxID=3363980 RepID=UPI0037BC3063